MATSNTSSSPRSSPTPASEPYKSMSYPCRDAFLSQRWAEPVEQDTTNQRIHSPESKRRHRTPSPVGRLLHRLRHPHHHDSHDHRHRHVHPSAQTLTVEAVPEACHQIPLGTPTSQKSASDERLTELCREYESLSRADIRRAVESFGPYSASLDRYLLALEEGRTPQDALIGALETL